MRPPDIKALSKVRWDWGMSYRTQTFQWSYGGSIASYGIGDFNNDGVLDFAFGGPVTPF
jgi:hypothetical protein